VGGTAGTESGGASISCVPSAIGRPDAPLLVLLDLKMPGGARKGNEFPASAQRRRFPPWPNVP